MQQMVLFELWNLSTVKTLSFLRRVKDQQAHRSLNVLVLNILLHVSAFQNTIIRESNLNMLRGCPMSWKAEKDGSCTYIVIDGVMVGILLGEGSQCEKPSLSNIPTITPSVTIYSSHTSLLFMTLGTISACSYWTSWWWHFEMPKHVGVN
jgi:hypothetical protein